MNSKLELFLVIALWVITIAAYITARSRVKYNKMIAEKNRVMQMFNFKSDFEPRKVVLPFTITFILGIVALIIYYL